MSNLVSNGERTRTLQVVKARGMPHSNQVREFLISDHGVDLIDVVVSEGPVVTGRARERSLAQARADQLREQQDDALRQHELQSRRLAIEASMAAARAELVEIDRALLDKASLPAETLPVAGGSASARSKGARGAKGTR